jgi:hypothetical protein
MEVWANRAAFLSRRINNRLCLITASPGCRRAYYRAKWS